MKIFLKVIFLGMAFFVFAKEGRAEVRDYGPFKEEPMVKILNNKIAYSYEEAPLSNSSYVSFHNKKYGPYPGTVKYLRISNNNWGVDMGGTIVIDSKIFGPYDSTRNLYINDNFFSFAYTKEKQTFQNINGKIFGPYDGGKFLYAFENFYVFDYIKNKESFINLNGQEYGPYEKVGNFYLSESNWAFDYGKGGKSYVNVKNEEYGPFNLIYNINVSKNHFAIRFQKDTGWYVAIIADGKEYPFEPTSYSVRINDDGLGFIYEKDNSCYVYYNGEEFGPYENFGMMYKFALSDKDWYLNYTMNNPQNFIKNGKRLESNQMPDQEPQPKYDRNNINGKEQIIIGGMRYGPYRNIFDPIFDQAGNWAFVYSETGIYDDTEEHMRLPGAEFIIKSNIGTGNNSNVFKIKEDGESLIVVKSGKDLNLILKHTNHKKNIASQVYAMKKYTDQLAKGSKITINQKYAINNFIVYGTKSNQKLTVAKRAEVVKSYKAKYKKLPMSEKDWEIVVGMAKIKK